MSLFLFAGENSGDLHGEALIRAIHAHCPSISIFGVGGPRMRTAGLETVMEMECFQVMGFIDVLLALPRIIRQFYQLRQILLQRQPKMVIFIDYPGFSLAMEKSLSKKGFTGKICHYICPSVWAWGKNRIAKMEKILDHLFVIFPFEKQLFLEEAPKKRNLQVHFVGHPLVKRMENPIASLPHALARELSKDRPLISLFPGSRKKELDRNLSLQLQVAKQLLALCPQALLALSVASPLLEKHICSSISDLPITLIEEKHNYALMRQSTLAIAKSGTITLELALHLIPTVVIYGISAFDLIIARDILKIRLPYYCIVNILLQKQVFPELLGPNLTEKKLFNEASAFLLSEEMRESCREKCRFLRTMLASRDPSEEIALHVKNFYRQA